MCQSTKIAMTSSIVQPVELTISSSIQLVSSLNRKKCNYNPNLVWINQIQKKNSACVYAPFFFHSNEFCSKGRLNHRIFHEFLDIKQKPFLAPKIRTLTKYTNIYLSCFWSWMDFPELEFYNSIVP